MIYSFRAMAILTLMLSAFGLQSLPASSGQDKTGVKSKKNPSNRRLLVRYKDDVSNNEKDKAHFSVGAYVVKSFNLPTNVDLVQVAKGISLKSAEDFYLSDPNVMYVEPDYPLHAYFSPPPSDDQDVLMDETGSEPVKDPKLGEQWGLNNLGQTGGTSDVDINAPQMWEKIRGDKNIVIAVIDTGINYNHPDLAANVWTNPGEIPGNGLDDDGNGVPDDIHGYNAVDENGDPMDDHGHGSHCAGIIGAQGQNEHGGSGVMQDVTIIGCKFLSAEGGGTTSGAIGCLEYLLDLKTRSKDPVNIFATSNSWGGGPHSQFLEDAIKDHQDAGILFVAAASNDSDNNDLVNTFPANYPLANIVSVAATDHKDGMAYFSNYGLRTVHVGAPGVDILSTVLDSNYEKMSGTSMATPFVTGLAGMIKANNPSLNYTQVKNLLMTGGVPTEALAGKTISGRRIRAVDTNGMGSLTCTDQVVSGRLSPSVDKLLMPVGEALTLSAINIKCSEANGDITIPMLPGDQSFNLLDNGAGIDSAANDGMYTKIWTAEKPGQFEFIFPKNDKVSVTVYDPSTMKVYEPQNIKYSYKTFSGVALKAEDDWIITIDTPFPLKFGGEDQAFNTITIGSNGALSPTNTSSISMDNETLPLAGHTSFIAPFWDDLNPAASSGDVYHGVLGTAPNREFIVEWRKVRHYSSSKNPASFQVVFFENSSDIQFNYRDVNFSDESLNFGASATIGIQTTPDKVVQLGFNTPVIKSRNSIRFKTVEPMSECPGDGHTC